MSELLFRRVWESGYGDPSTALILLKLAECATDDGLVQMKVMHLATFTRQSERNCRRILGELAMAGIIDIHMNVGRNHTNTYQLYADKLPEPVHATLWADEQRRIAQLEMARISMPQLRREITNNYARFFLKIGRRDGFHCRQCQSTFDLEIDHILAIANGGTNDISNLQLLCETCNGHKTDK